MSATSNASIRRRLDALDPIQGVRCPGCGAGYRTDADAVELIDAGAPPPPIDCAFPARCQRVLIEIHEEIIGPGETPSP
jgi:hypothetical protein